MTANGNKDVVTQLGTNNVLLQCFSFPQRLYKVPYIGKDTDNWIHESK